MTGEPSPRADADRAAERAGVTVRVLRPAALDPADVARVGELCARIWAVPVEQTPVEASTLVAYVHAGGYVGLAESAGTDGGARLVGTAVGFVGRGTGDDGPRTFLHSHIAGVDRTRIGGGVGLALKLDQRAWCLEHGLDEIEWTFDPLIARNAHFNLTRLGAEVADYLADFYGPMTDGVNRGLPSDRLLVRWELGRVSSGRPTRRPAAPAAASSWPRMLADDHGRPVLDLDRLADRRPVVVAVPADAEALFGEQPDRVLAWRRAVRTAVTGLIGRGYAITGFDRSVPGYRMEKRN